MAVTQFLVVVCITYATFVLQADHEGEGGTLALHALLLGVQCAGVENLLTANTGSGVGPFSLVRPFSRYARLDRDARLVVLFGQGCQLPAGCR
jgi:hypothetical protein